MGGPTRGSDGMRKPEALPADNDGTVLYITADTALYRIRLTTKGAGF